MAVVKEQTKGESEEEYPGNQEACNAINRFINQNPEIFTTV